MFRTVLLVSALLAAGLAAPVSAEEVRVGRCEIDACVVACVHVTEPCRGDGTACVLFAFRYWCV